MVVRTIAQSLRDIAEAAADLIEILTMVGRDAYLRLPAENRLLFRATKNAMAELGEACRSVPADMRARWPDVDWQGLTGLRNVVVHNYGALDTAILLAIVTHDMPLVLAAASDELAGLPA